MVSNEYPKYISGHGGNFTNLLKARFLNKPGIAVVVIVLGIVAAIAVSNLC